MERSNDTVPKYNFLEMLTKGVTWNLSCPVMGNWINTSSQFP